MGVKGKAAGAKTKPRQAPKKDKAAPKKPAAVAAKKDDTKKPGQPAPKAAAKPNGSAMPSDGAPPTTHNLTDEQRQALAHQHLREFEAALATKKKGDADFKNACKRIKAEGGNVTKLKLMIELRTDEGIAQFKRDVADMQEVARWMGATQLEMFGPATGDPDRTDAVEKAYLEGKAAGFAGEKPEQYGGGHHASSRQYHRWVEGYRDAQAVISGGFKPPTPVEQAIKDSKAKADDADGDEKKGTFAQKLGAQTDAATKAVRGTAGKGARVES